MSWESWLRGRRECSVLEHAFLRRPSSIQISGLFSPQPGMIPFVARPLHVPPSSSLPPMCFPANTLSLGLSLLACYRLKLELKVCAKTGVEPECMHCETQERKDVGATLGRSKLIVT